MATSYASIPKDLKNIQGVWAVMNNINTHIERIVDARLDGMIKAAALVRWETEHGYPKTPVDYGNLRASWFVVSARGKIVRGGGKPHTPGGEADKFKGPKAGEIAAQHMAVLTEMQGKARSLADINGGPFVIMGYSANYSFYVHEMLGRGGKEVNWSRPKSGAKWFEIALKKQRNNILKLVKSGTGVKIKGFTHAE